MSDDADAAQGFEELRRQIAIDRATTPDTTPRRTQPGLCEDCADDIDPQRLAASPTVRRCLTCQESFERLGRLRSKG